MRLGISESVQAMSGCLDSARAMVGAGDDQQIVQVLRDVETLSRTLYSVTPQTNVQVKDLDIRYS